MNFSRILFALGLIISTYTLFAVEESVIPVQCAVPPAPRYKKLNSLQLNDMNVEAAKHKFGKLTDNDRLEIQQLAADAIKSKKIETIKQTIYDIGLVATLDLEPKDQKFIEKVIAQLEAEQNNLLNGGSSNTISFMKESSVAKIPLAPLYKKFNSLQLHDMEIQAAKHKFGKLTQNDRLEIQLVAADAIKSKKIEAIKEAIYDISLVTTLDLRPRDQEFIEEVIAQLEAEQTKLNAGYNCCIS